ncbi:MAG: glucose-6-phosphate dehydrogenase [Bacteroidetes bacterium]|nr:glucose-6-phosphate dehydrogenase [Bacteroidota bacterium]
MNDRKIPPYLLVIVGGTGDLARRKLLPAICRLRDKHLSEFLLIGAGTGKKHNDETYRDFVARSVEEEGIDARVNGESFDWAYYQSVGGGTVEEYKTLANRIEELEKKTNLPGNRVFYLAVPPSVFPNAIKNIGEVGLNKSKGEVKLVVEKPFGQDLDSARELNTLVHKYFDESQIYRIDHYLGKETVQNLIAFRFSNAMFESLWNRDRIERVEITVAETVGAEHRAGYYDKVGALRDMIQNHLTQITTLTAMEIPTALEADAVRHEKVKVLKTISPISPDNVVFGQYMRGAVQGTEVEGYLEEERVAPDSKTETFVALKLNISNWRWQGVPFVLRTGKRMFKGITEVAITFRRPPVSIFRQFSIKDIQPNKLIMTLQPNEGFDLSFKVKEPGDSYRLSTQRLHFQYGEVFGRIPDAYETLLLDVLKGDQTLFVRSDEVESSWELYTPLLSQKFDVHKYASGTWGPLEAERLLDGEKWTTL